MPDYDNFNAVVEPIGNGFVITVTVEKSYSCITVKEYRRTLDEARMFIGLFGFRC